MSAPANADRREKSPCKKLKQLVFTSAAALVLVTAAAATTQIGPGTEIAQEDNNFYINFSQNQNFSYIDIYGKNTDFGGSNFSGKPENRAEAVLDFYDHTAGRQDYVTNFSASANSENVDFSVGNLPSNDFYEAFFSNNDTRIFIGYTDSQDRFNFSTMVDSVDVSVFNYGEKGVEANNISFNDSDPDENEALDVKTNVSNEGVVDSETFNQTTYVDTYNGTAWVDQELLADEFMVPADDTVSNGVVWKVKPGPWRFRSALDPNDEIKETNENNNNFTKLLDVPSYNVFYGGSDTKLKLGAGDKEVYIWNPSTDQGNLFFADVDSEYVFSNLEPVGTDDYSEIDETLNLTGHNDSVLELWDPNSDGTADETRQFSVGQRTLQVPVANSTTDGTFKTGILYDSDDGTPYDGSQDLVFVTKINQSTEGEYGIYDYEIRVPSSLSQLKPGQDMVEIFTEIK